MNKFDILFIRGCKTIDPHKRIKSLMRRVYSSHYTIKDMNFILLRIIECNCPMTVQTFNIHMEPTSYGNLTTNNLYDWYNERLNRVLVSYIRLVAIDKLDGYIPPLYWRKRLIEQRKDTQT